MMSANSIDKVLVFDLWGTYGHFRRLESTTSPLTYSIPTGTAMAGIIAAILGFERDSYYDLFTPETFKYSIKTLSPTRKVRLNISLINTKDGYFTLIKRKGHEPRTLIPYEFLINPKYRVYVWLKDKELFKKLAKLIKEHKSYYTPYLGLAPLIADFKFVGIETPQIIEHSRECIRVDSIIEKKHATIIPKEGQKYLIERIPRYFNKDRVVQEFLDIILEATGKPIFIRPESEKPIYVVRHENVVFI